MREQLRLANVDQANTETEFDELREENASLRRELAEKREEHLKSDLYWRESYIEAETERLQLESRLAIAIEGVKKALAEYYRSDLDVIEVERILTDTLSRLRVRLIAAAALEGEGD